MHEASAPTGVGEEVATGAADESADEPDAPTATDPVGAATSLDPRDDAGQEAAPPQGATSASAADDAGGGDVTGGDVAGDASEAQNGEGLPGLATGTAGGNGIGGGEGSTAGPLDPEDTGTHPA
jgi:hypothetical protein